MHNFRIRYLPHILAAFLFCAVLSTSVFLTPTYFSFEDYRAESDIMRDINRVVKPGMTRARVDDVLARTAGAVTESDDEGKKVFYRYKIINNDKYYKKEGVIYGGAWVIGVQYSDKLHVEKIWVEERPQKLGPECFSTKEAQFKLGQHVFSIPRTELMRAEGDKFEIGQFGGPYCYKHGDPPISVNTLRFWGDNEAIKMIGGPDANKYASVIHVESWAQNDRSMAPIFLQFQEFLHDGGLALDDLPMEDGFYFWGKLGKNIQKDGKTFSWNDDIDRVRARKNKIKFFYHDVFISADKDFKTSQNYPVMFLCTEHGAWLGPDGPAINCQSTIDFKDNSAVFIFSQSIRADAPKSEWKNFYRLTQKYVQSLEMVN